MRAKCPERILFAAAMAAAVTTADVGAASPSFQTIAQFPDPSTGQQPEAGVIVDPSDGRTLYGTTDRGGPGGADGGVLFKLVPPSQGATAWTEQILYVFPGREDGGYPLQLVRDGKDGLFGDTLDGGPSLAGTIFHARPSAGPPWVATQIYGFKSGSDGASPSGLVRIGSAVLGTTDNGGTGGCTDPFGDVVRCGTVFRLQPPSNPGAAWSKEIVYAFKGKADGAIPSGHLLVAGNTIFGTTALGGSGQCTENGILVGCGVVYALTGPNGLLGGWTQHVVYSFPGGLEGGTPVDGVIADGAGGFFGVTAGGGRADSDGFPLGTVYRLAKTARGWEHRVIYRFAGSLDGYSPEAGLSFDAATSTLYGTTYLGGASRGGTLFSLHEGPAGAWTKTILHNFTGAGDGANPSSALVSDRVGALYGTTLFGSGGGTVYRFVP